MKILLVGNETSDTDHQATIYAEQNNLKNYGLVLDPLFFPIDGGCYHTSLADLSPGDIIQQLASKFNLIELLDQDISTYPHYKVFVTTMRMMYNLEELGFPVNYRDKETSKNFLYWKKFLQDNKSFCFYPYAAFVEKDSGQVQLCPKNNFALKMSNDINNWQADADFNIIRDKMEQGIPMEGDLCAICKLEEKLGHESARQFETLECALKINAEHYKEFRDIKNPIYYEVRPSNKCNIRCRTCTDGFSHLIEKEWKELKFPLTKWKFNSVSFDKIDISTLQQVYFGGGEPTVMPEFYSFLRKCIAQKKTDFNLNIGTNGYKISNTLLELLDHFTNVCFAFSFDGYGIVNDYIRWGSEFDIVLNNSRELRRRGHQVSLQTVFSMYNLTRLHDIYEFFDREFSNTGLLINLAGAEEYGGFEPLNHPLPEMVVSSLEKCIKTKTYFSNGRSAKSQVDGLLNYYSNADYKVNIEDLRKFFNYNDKLDMSRGSNLKDYIPELANARKLFDI